MRKFFSWFSLIIVVINIAVILWGAYVRATGSGAGCGSHWPLCNGEVIPRSVEQETRIEFTHRLSSGVAFLGVLIQYLLARKIYIPGSAVRRFAFLSFVLIIIEALIGAALVLFEWVAHDDSLGRAISISLHLINTLLLLAALSLTWWASLGIESEIPLDFKISIILKYVIPIFVLFIGASGAIAALGDTLFPVSSLQEGIRQDFSNAAHYLIRLRIYHPFLAVIGAGGVIYFISTQIIINSRLDVTKRLAMGVIVFGCLQIILGLINVKLLAPVWMQLVHLLFADILWINYVLLLTSTGIVRLDNLSKEEYYG